MSRKIDLQLFDLIFVARKPLILRSCPANRYLEESFTIWPQSPSQAAAAANKSSLMDGSLWQQRKDDGVCLRESVNYQLKPNQLTANNERTKRANTRQNFSSPALKLT